jgi:DNA-binding Lrp family transcriptional regulator
MTTCRDEIIAALENGPLNYEDLAEMTGRHRSTVMRAMKKLRAEKLVRIVFFEPDPNGRDQGMVFGLGRGPDAKRKKTPNVERMRMCRRKRDRSGLNGFLYGRRNAGQDSATATT